MCNQSDRHDNFAVMVEEVNWWLQSFLYVQALYLPQQGLQALYLPQQGLQALYLPQQGHCRPCICPSKDCRLVSLVSTKCQDLQFGPISFACYSCDGAVISDS